MVRSLAGSTAASVHVRRPGTSTTRRRRTRAHHHLRGAATEPPDQAFRGRCGSKRPKALANGERKAIADVDVGDEVLATNLETGRTEARTVTDTMVMHHDGDLLDLTIEDDDGQGIIQTTDRHPFWSVTDGDWEPAIELSVGEELRQADGSTATVVKLTERPGRQDMWDLTVEVDHNFYVDFGNGAVLVHNQGADNPNSAEAMARKLKALEEAQGSAVTTRNLPDGRVRYYGAETAARTPGATRGAAYVTEWDPATGAVRSWMESYDHAGNVVRVHP
jgi:hypothetical protein